MHTTIELLLRTLFAIALGGYLVRGFVGAYLSTLLLRTAPELHTKLGAPMPRDFWMRSKFPLREYVLQRPFPSLPNAGTRAVQVWSIFFYCIFWLWSLSIPCAVAVTIFAYPYF